MLSILWLVLVFFLERHVVYDPIDASYDRCVDRVLDDWSVCDKSMDDALVKAPKAEPIIFFQKRKVRLGRLGYRALGSSRS